MTGRNAWQISDTSTAANSGASYNRLLAQNNIILAAARGWTLEVDARMIASGATTTNYFEYAEGRQPNDERYLVYMSVSGLDVILRPWTGTPRVCPLAMDGSYHTFGIRKEPGFALAELIYDDVSIGTFGSVNSAAAAAVDGGVGFDEPDAQRRPIDGAAAAVAHVRVLFECPLPRLHAEPRWICR